MLIKVIGDSGPLKYCGSWNLIRQQTRFISFWKCWMVQKIEERCRVQLYVVYTGTFPPNFLSVDNAARWLVWRAADKLVCFTLLVYCGLLLSEHEMIFIEQTIISENIVPFHYNAKYCEPTTLQSVKQLRAD